MSEQSNNILLSANNLTKAFGDFTANNKVNFSILKGEIHALLGENGAGKSTFVKMIYGLLKPDNGDIFWKNKIIDLSGPKHARDLGIGMVFQHFSLFNALTVLENISLAMPDSLNLFDLENKIHNVSQEYGLQIDPNSRIYNLSVGEQQRVEIIRCLLQDPELLIMDEPTSVLTPQEISKLFDVLLKLSEKGCSILFITHKLEEVRSLTSRATILRRGANVGTVNTSDHTAKSLSQMMVGHEVIDTNNKKLKIDNNNSLLINELSRPAETQFSVSLKNINLKANGGEILGIAGIAGNGQFELMETLIGEHIINDENKIIRIMKVEKFLTFKKLLNSCDIGLSTVMISSRIKKLISFKKIKTKEDYILWLKLSQKYQIIGIDKFLTRWRKAENSLSSSTIQKISDAYRVYNKYLDYNVIYSAYRTFILSINYTLKLFKQKFIYKNV